MNGFSEVVTWILCSKKEITSMLNKENDKRAVINGNPRSSDFEVCILSSFVYLYLCRRTRIFMTGVMIAVH